ncbi:MAG: carbohydrate ABC transporter permease [Firmicutes bacterium]|nr:carbohydrate ABC transporter permease [Bacillota bacterium]
MVRRSLFRNLWFYALVALTVLLSAFPFLVMFFSSVKIETQQYIYPPRLLPARLSDWTLKNYRDVLNPSIFPFTRYFGNSFVTSALTSGISVLLATLGSYSFARLRYPGRHFIQRSVVLVYMFGGILLVVPLFQIIVNVGLYDTRVSLVIVYLMQTLPVALYMLGNYFRSVPKEIEEAAIIDGCSRLSVLFRVVLPLSAPAIASVFIYTFMISWNEYLFASVFLISHEKYTLPMGLSSLFYTEHFVWGRMMAASLLTAVPIVIMFLSVQRFIAAGLTGGGVKG